MKSKLNKTLLIATAAFAMLSMTQQASAYDGERSIKRQYASERDHGRHDRSQRRDRHDRDHRRDRHTNKHRGHHDKHAHGHHKGHGHRHSQYARHHYDRHYHGHDHGYYGHISGVYVSPHLGLQIRF